MGSGSNKHAQWEVYRARVDSRKAQSCVVPVQTILECVQSPCHLRAWLESKAPQQIVGNIQTPDDTVLANFLWEKLGVYVLTFGRELAYGKAVGIALPQWCYEYTKLEDEHYRAYPPTNGDWTAAEALVILQETLAQHRGG